MGGKRIAEQVRRALIRAAKTGTVVVAIDASGCFYDQGEGCAVPCPPDVCRIQDAGTGDVHTDGARHDAGKDGG